MVAVVLDPTQRGSSLLVTHANELVTTSGAAAAGAAKITEALGAGVDTAAEAFRMERLQLLKTHDVDEGTDGIAYVLKAGSLSTDPWYVIRIVEFGTDQTTLRYAGPRNNPSYATAGGGWFMRTSLTYGLLSEV